jgi:hypothetical protein
VRLDRHRAEEGVKIEHEGGHVPGQITRWTGEKGYFGQTSRLSPGEALDNQSGGCRIKYAVVASPYLYATRDHSFTRGLRTILGDSSCTAELSVFFTSAGK